MTTLNYGDLGWIKIENYPPWPVRLADSYEIQDDIRKFERDDLVLVYFFGYENYAYADPQLICDYQESFNENPSQILQIALDEAFEWQLAEASKVPTRRKKTPTQQKQPSSAKKLFYEDMKRHRKDLMKMMKMELKRWEKEMNFRSSEDSEEEEEEESSESEIKEDPVSLDEEIEKQRCIECGKVSMTKQTLNQAPQTIAYIEEKSEEKVPFGVYAFYMVENHVYNIANEKKQEQCPYPQCDKKFYINFELIEHINTVHLQESNSLLTKFNDSSDSLYCDYPNCSSKFFGDDARQQRRRHFETVHLNIDKRECIHCSNHIYPPFFPLIQETVKKVKSKQLETKSTRTTKKRGRPKAAKQTERKKRKPGRPKSQKVA